MDNVPLLVTSAVELEQRAARVADPSVDLKTKLAVANELRDIMDNVKDTEATRVLPHMIPVLLDCLRSGEPSYQKESLEYGFRKAIIETLHRIPMADSIRPQAHAFIAGMLHIVRTDNEENAIIGCKTLVELSRCFRPLSDELLKDFFSNFHERCNSLPNLIELTLSEDSVALDPNQIIPSTQSFKVFYEICSLLVAMLQVSRQTILPIIQEHLKTYFQIVGLESSAQRAARENFESMGDYWTGMAPTIRNPQTYADFIQAQIKLLHFLLFLTRGAPETYEQEAEKIILAALRILQDCPANAIQSRKDLLMVLRHLISTPARRSLLPHVDKMLDERVLLGTGTSSRETVRALAFGCVADLVHHFRTELTPPQMHHICIVYLRYFHNPYLSNQIHNMAAKVIYNMIECIATKDTPQSASKLLAMLLESTVEKVESMALVYNDVVARVERAKKKGSKDEPEAIDFSFIEKSRPVNSATYAVEKIDDLTHEYRGVFRTLLHGFRAIIGCLKKLDAPAPDGIIVSRLFEASVTCMALFEEQRESQEAMDWLGSILADVNLHVFQEVWTAKMDFMDKAVNKRPALMHIANSLFQRESHSPTLVAIVLKFCLDKLEELGDMEDQAAAILIKWFKTVFSAVTMHPQANEALLATHVGKLVMDCFPLAAKASKPTHYFHLLRGLFRAIGGGGGRFEILYKEVLPLLPEMLECLNRQLLTSDIFARDMVVELCLTVPLRLTHLLPYLTYLMKPLALALRGSSELVSQGLRTLELCIDNLQPDFLDPTLNTVLRELMEALHSHLRPVPANHHHAHTTIRILGKLGGRNRRLLERPPELQYRPQPETTKVRFSLAGAPGAMDIGPSVQVACSTITGGRSLAPYRMYSFNVLESVAGLLLQEGVKGRDREETLLKCLEGIFDAIHLPELQERAEPFIKQFARHVFNTEVKKGATREAAIRKHPSPLLTCFLDALPHGLARHDAEEAKRAEELVTAIMNDMFGLLGTDVTEHDLRPPLHQIALRFNQLCLEDQWVQNSAGCSGIKILATSSEIGSRYIGERIVDVTRTLLHVLKNMPYDLPNDVAKVTDVMFTVLRMSAPDMKAPVQTPPISKPAVSNLVGIYFGELSGQNPIVRKAAQSCIELLSQLLEMPIVDMLMPQRERMLTAIYTKPLRALPFSIQIGMIEAIRYCLSLDPPLPELNDELLRLLHEALALADAEDVTLMTRGNPRQSSLEIVKLKVACIKLLTASMPLTDFFNKQQNTRQRITSVYFKSLYSHIQEVKEVAHEGLRMVLMHQARLPKDLLQTGLRPILMNLADPKRLSVSGLEGLARLLELLTNYFKVEIGHKLLDHFRIVADPQMLLAASRLPLFENEGITKLVRLANIFHLLPSSANMFLDNLVNAIVQTEAHMHFSRQSPFSEPLAKYLDRYPVDAIDFFMRHLQFPRHIRSLRSILQAGLAPNLLRELMVRTPAIINACLVEPRDPSLLTPGLQLCSDIAELNPTWLTENDHVIQALLTLWRIEPTSDINVLAQGEVTQRYSLMLSIIMKALEQSRRVDLLFDIVAVFARELPVDQISISQFLYRHVALDPSLTYRRNVLMRFLTWFEDTTYSWKHKTYVLRFIVTPTVLVNAAQPTKEGLLDSDIIQWIHNHIWIPMYDDTSFAEADDMFIIELLHLTTVLVHQYPELLADAKKDIIKCAWHYINREDALVKHTAYLLAARFFEAWEGPPKFHMTAWTGLLSRPHAEGKALLRQALNILAPVLLRHQTSEAGYPQWAKTTRRLLAEESGGWSQLGLIYHLMAQHSALFYPVRALFIPHIVNSTAKLGLSPSSSTESRILSVDILQVVYEWEQKASNSMNVDSTEEDGSSQDWPTPLAFRESIISYLMRLATQIADPQSRMLVVPRALNLLKSLVGPSGWTDVTIKVQYFSRMLQQTELNTDSAMAQAVAAAKVLQVVASEKPDSWYTANAEILSKVIRRGLVSEEAALHDALYPIFDRLNRLFPLPKEDEEQQPQELADFFNFVRTAIGENLRNATNLRGTLLMLKSVVQTTPERIQLFNAPLIKVLGNKSKDHCQSQQMMTGYDTCVRHIISILEICQISIGFLGDQRKHFIATLLTLIEKSKSGHLCKCMLDMMREWALNSRDAFPNMKDKAALLLKMTSFEQRGGERGEALLQNYLELIYEIYTDPGLRRSDLTTRLEQAFLVGCRASDFALRERFIDLLDASIPRALVTRMTYIFGVQNWTSLADRNWIYLALHLLLSCADGDALLVPDKRIALESTPIVSPFPLGRISSIIRPIQRILFLDPQKAHEAWVSLFPTLWATLSRREQVDVTHHLISLLSKDHHIAQSELRPNVIQTLLEGVLACSPPITLPPHLVKYLAKNFGAWHVALQILENSMEYVRDDEQIVQDAVNDSLCEVYAEISEEDLFYGLWRRRSLYSETNIAMSLEQIGMWEQASAMYEAAQNKSRAGLIPFTEPEYCLWEDHWILASEKLQQWDTLYELARSENNYELMLESAWRIKDWAENRETLEEQINLLPSGGTPRRRIFEAFVALLKLPAAVEKNVEFTKSLEDGMQLALRKWASLPRHLTHAHVPLLQNFQQFVELQEAVQIFGSLSSTNAQNLEKKSSDLKMVLQAWRERLPNICDDISIWSDLVAWRQNVFDSINKAYIPLINNGNQAGAAAGATNTFGYRGYHETAWIINRFAHVARKHDLLDVCFSSLNKIYTLPNIEISEAFLKLREQARCHFQKPGDLQAGLEVINNTNLMYFSNEQKAEFYTLKGMFYAKFERHEEADRAFGSAVQLDISQAKAWAAWGKYSDRMFKEHPTEIGQAFNAVSCYLQAAGLYKSRKSRPFLTRILWLLSIDDSTLAISRAFDTYKGDAAFWYWITLIPQLCMSMQHREVKQARYLLLNLAKLYPQALFFNLRSTRDELAAYRKQALQIAQQRAAQGQQPLPHLAAAAGQSVPLHNQAEHQDGASGSNGDAQRQNASNEDTNGQQSIASNPRPAPDTADQNRSRPDGTAIQRPTWETVDEIGQILKTAFPLLIMSLETIVDQLGQRFKAPPEEELYRLVCMMSNEALQHFVNRSGNPDDDGSLGQQLQGTILRLGSQLQGAMKKEYEDEFMRGKFNLSEYIQKLQQWKEKHERYLDARPRFQSLDSASHYLTDFQHTKFDEVEVFGQYTEEKDSNQNFIRIQKFDSKFENCKAPGYCYRRVTVHGHDNSRASYAVQIPSGRHCRREERVMHLFRTFNGVLSRKKESQKRNLHFHVPVAIPCGVSIRLLQSDSSYVTLADIYDQYCDESGIGRDEAMLLVGEKIKVASRELKMSTGRNLNKNDIQLMKKELMQEIHQKLIPEDVITRYMTRSMGSPSELWRMRKQFTLQIAACSFLTYVFAISSRYPLRYHISRSTGQIAMSESLPGTAPPHQQPLCTSVDSVPFRFTPSMQHFVGQYFTEGVLAPSIMTIARCLTEPEYELEQQLCLHSRDEILTWFHGARKSCNFDLTFRNLVINHSDSIVKKAEIMACKVEREQATNVQYLQSPNATPVCHSVQGLLSTATNPMFLSKMPDGFLWWY